MRIFSAAPKAKTHTHAHIFIPPPNISILSINGSDSIYIKHYYYLFSITRIGVFFYSYICHLECFQLFRGIWFFMSDSDCCLPCNNRPTHTKLPCVHSPMLSLFSWLSNGGVGCRIASPIRIPNDSGQRLKCLQCILPWASRMACGAHICRFPGDHTYKLNFACNFALNYSNQSIYPSIRSATPK